MLKESLHLSSICVYRRSSTANSLFAGVLFLMLAGQLLSAAGQSAGATVRGTVINAKTHEPLKRATLFLVDRGSLGRRLGALSDASGIFAFTNIAPGSYRLEGDKDGYVRGNSRNLSVLELAPGQEIKDVVYSLTPAAVLTGRVVDDLGDPASGAQLHVLRAVYSSGSPALIPVGMQVTNDRGEFRVPGLSAGTYYVKATYRDPLQRSGAFKADGEDYGYPAVFYPGATDLSQAAPLELNDGDERAGVEIRLLRARTFAVMGTVVNAATGQPAGGASVVLYAKSTGGYAASEVVASAQTDAFGRFHVTDVPAGAYGLAAGAFLADGTQLSGRTRLDVSESATANIVSITLRRGASIKGVIRLDDASTKVDWFPQLALFLRPAGDSSLRADIQADGSFEVRDVADDTYLSTFVYLPEDYYVKSVHAGSQDVLRSGLIVQNGLSEPLSIVLSSAGGRIDGVVANRKGEAVPAAHIVVAHDDNGAFYRHVTADQNGHFSIRGIVPGSYRMIALENLPDGAYESPTFSAHYSRGAKSLTVEEKGRYSLMLDLSTPE
jgi:5-hydroxyisourate hydrolase-like protein (transthyretin family)